MNSSAIDSQHTANVPQPSSNQSFKVRAGFVGREVSEALIDIADDIQYVMASPFAFSGLVLGGISGIVGGSLYKTAKYAMGQGAQTKKLKDYMIKSANWSAEKVMMVASAIFMPIGATSALAVGVCSVVGAFAGALATPVVAPIYKMVKECRGESVQAKKLSDYIIKSAELGAKGFLCLSVVGLVGLVILSCPPAAMFPLLLWELAGSTLLLCKKVADNQAIGEA